MKLAAMLGAGLALQAGAVSVNMMKGLKAVEIQRAQDAAARAQARIADANRVGVGLFHEISGFKTDTDTESEGTVTVSVFADPRPREMSEEEQRGNVWFPVAQSSPMKVKGYTQWRPTQHGFAFKCADNSEIQCNAANAANLDKKITLDFSCHSGSALLQASNAETDSSKGGQKRPQIVVGVINTDPTNNDGRDANFNGDDSTQSPEYRNDNVDRQDYQGTLWYTSDGAPYGFYRVWPHWNYPYWACTNAGYYGCPALDQRGYCAKTPVYFGRVDLQPGPNYTPSGETIVYTAPANTVTANSASNNNNVEILVPAATMAPVVDPAAVSVAPAAPAAAAAAPAADAAAAPVAAVPAATVPAAAAPAPALLQSTPQAVKPVFAINYAHPQAEASAYVTTRV